MTNLENIALIVAVLSAASLLNAFPTGKERTYNLLNNVTLNDHKNGPNIAYALSGSVRVGCVWGTDELKLLQFHLTGPRLQLPGKNARLADQKSLLETAVNRPFYAIWDSGAITEVYVHGKEDPSLANVKKAVVSLFQYQLLVGEYDELDVSGKCQVGYATRSKNTYEKVWRRCASDDLVAHRRADRAIGVAVESTRMSTFKVTDEGILLKAHATERHSVAVVANKNAGGYMDSSILLEFDGSISNIAAITTATIEEAIKTVKGIKKQTILTDVLVPFRRKENASFKDAVRLAKNDLTDEMIGTHKAALALVKVVASAKTTTKSEFLKVLNVHTHKDIKGPLIDILAAIQTKDSHEAVLETLRFHKEVDADLVERYLQGLAVGTRPLEWILNDLLRLTRTSFETDKVRDTLVQTTAAMAYRFARRPEHSYNSKSVVQTQDFIVSSLSKCEDIPCKELYLRALHNLQSVTTVSLLLEYVYQPDRIVSVAAMKALRNFPKDTWTFEHKKVFEAIFFQLNSRFDSSVRTLALDVLLEIRPNQQDLTHLIFFLRSNETQFEVKKYLLQKLQMLATDCSHFRKAFEKVLLSDSQLNNYHILGQRGMTTAMTRTFSKAPSFNATLLSVQEIFGGVLKRGIVDMTVSAERDRFSVFTLGLYAGGLSSFVSSNTDVDPDEPATAGMEVTVQGAYFRPLQFFGSQSELMGHAWSGTASEPTDAYTATTLLHDHNEVIRLQNGAGLSIAVLSAVSIDLNGQVQFSLWNRNAHCQVDKNSGIALLGSIALETSFINLRSQFTVTQEPQMNLESDIDFSGDVKLCIQLSQPETELKHSIEKSTKVHGTKVDRRTTRTQTFQLPGFTHVLNKKNSDMCNVILGS